MSGNRGRVRRVQEIRRSNAAGPHGRGKRELVFEPDYSEREQIGTARVQLPGREPELCPVFAVTEALGELLVEVRGHRRYVPPDWSSELELFD